ncbi:MAG: extracellular solute-binding protein [Treponema sp.]|nr:extracellular solute-binding protein [Treponema sp.]
MLFGLSLCATAQSTTEIFTIDFGSDGTAFYLIEFDEVGVAAFLDTKDSDVNILICDPAEIKQIKKIAYESKLLVKSVTTLEQYESQKIPQTIVKKFQDFGSVTKEEYGEFDDLGFARIRYFITQKTYAKHKDKFDNLSMIDTFNQLNGLGGSKDTDSSSKLVVWSFTDEIEGMIKNYYQPAHPDMLIEYSMTPTDQFPSKLDPPLASGYNCPDVVSLEDAFARRYIESDLLLPLDDVYAEIKNKMVDYPMQIGSYNGHVYAMSWQICPGAMFYRRSLAKKYLGTDDPKMVQKYFNSPEKLIETARLLKSKSSGKCRVVSSNSDLFRVYLGARKKPWIVDDSLVIDPVMEDYMSACKIMNEEKLSGGAGQWSEAWFAGMNGEVNDADGKKCEIFSYFFPGWGLHYVLKTNAVSTSGDWAMCRGPSSWYWGSTWLAATKWTKNPEKAKELIKYLVSDDKFATEYAKETGDVVGNTRAQDSVKNLFSEPYLGGQNHYKEFCEYAKGVDGTLIQSSDMQIESLFNEAVEAYANGEKYKRQAIRDFMDQVSITLGY